MLLISLNNGTISNILNLTVGGDFSNNDSSSDLDWGIMIVLQGSAFVTVDRIYYGKML